MGLDISVYNNIKKVADNSEDGFLAYVLEESWEHKIKNLEKGASYDGDIIYTMSSGYSIHNAFRVNLLKMIGRDDLLDNGGRIDWDKLEIEKDIDFYELILFADNEGCLDWEVSKTLSNQFMKHKEIAEKKMQGIFKSLYSDWTECFNNAKDKGVVVFH